MAPRIFDGRARRVVAAVNSGVLALGNAPLLGRLLGGVITPITYTGRKSGRSYTLPVGFRRNGDTVTIGVELAEQKKWWRNFLGDGAPMTIRLDGAERTGHAVARRTSGGRAEVVLTLDPR